MSEIGQSEINDSIFLLFEKYGFIRFKNGFYVFNNSKTSSFKNFIRTINWPEGLLELNTEKSASLFLKVFKTPLTTLGINNAIKEWSDKNSFVSPTLALEEGVINRAEYVKSLVPIVDLSRPQKNSLFLVDPNNKNRWVKNIHQEMYLLLEKTSIQDIVDRDGTVYVEIKFDPYNLEALTYGQDVAGNKTAFLNTYVPPKWMEMDVEPKFHGFIKDLFYHLLPIEDEREYVLDWFHHSLVGRCETVLCLIGARATGKGLVANNICESLHGRPYFQIAKQEILTDKFNNEFNNKRLIFFDEVDISGEREVAKFKAFANDKIALEKKGVDSETVDNYASMILASNSKKDFRVEPQDRRFSVPEITDVQFNTVYPETEIDAFCKRIKEADSIEIAEFGHWLLQRTPAKHSQRPLKGSYFFDLCRLSMPEWKSFIIDYIIKYGQPGEPIAITEIKRKFKIIFDEDAAFIVKKGTLETFLGDYMHDGKYKLGKVVTARDPKKYRDVLGILPNPKFIGKYGQANLILENKKKTDEQSDNSLDNL
jgi:hypothetical protein